MRRLRKPPREQFDAIMEFDATETDPDVVAVIRAVMLQALTFAMRPFFDSYKKLVEPLDADLHEESVQTALTRATAGSSAAQRFDGLRFLARSPDARAIPELQRVVRDAEDTESDERVLAELTKAAEAVEQRVASEE